VTTNRPAGIFGKFRGAFIGDRTFYGTVLKLAVPIIIQSTITAFVSLLDNIMVGQIGTVQMSGVAIANQLLFVFSLAIFGGLSGPGIFGAQFFGAGDTEGIRHTFRYKLWASALLLITAVTVFLTCGDKLISLYLTGEGDVRDAAAMLGHGRDYLHIMLWGLLPFALSQTYGGTLRETGESMLQMIAGIAAVITNLILNYILIFGKLGFPVLGVKGAAIATVISRYVELAVIMIYAHRHTGRFPFIKGIFRTVKTPLALVKSISIKGLPLFVNELFWALSMSVLMQIFSTRGLNVVGGLNISSTVSNLFSVVFLSMGTAVAVLVGQALGAGDVKRAKSHARKLTFFCFCCCLFVGGVMAAVSPWIPNAYNTTDDVRRLATLFMVTSAAYMPINGITHCCYFTIRSGGKTVVPFLFDSVYSWLVFIPFTYILVHHTSLNISVLYPLSFSPDILKCLVGILIVRAGHWAQNIVSGQKTLENSSSITP
jgi:putative MATE family efflux protein